MNGNKSTEGMSVKEIEEFAKKHRFEVFFCLAFILACFFSFVIYSAWWSILAASIGGILGILLPVKVAGFSKTVFQFVFKQEKTTQLVLGIVLLIIAIFVSPLIFLMLGMHGGKDIHASGSSAAR